MDVFDSITEQGFSIIPNVITEDEIAAVLADVREANSAHSRAGMRHALRYSEISQLAHGRPLTELASKILKGSAFPYRATLFDKSPAINWLVVWHQDRALPLRERREVSGWGPWSVKDGVQYANAPADALSKIVALRVHLDDSVQDNGPLRVLPGTHKTGVLSDHAIQQLAQRISPVSCTVFRGGVVVMRPLLVHSSSKSRIVSHRRVLHIEYAAERFVADGLELATD